LKISVLTENNLLIFHPVSSTQKIVNLRSSE